MVVCFYSSLNGTKLLKEGYLNMAEWGTTCTICKVLHGWSKEQKDEKQNNDRNPKKTMQLQFIRVQ